MTRLNPWMQRAMIGLSLLVLAAGSATGWLLLNERDARRWVSHTASVREELADLRITALRSEMSRRGYLMSGNHEDLIAYETGARQLWGKLAAVRRLTADNTVQQDRLAELQSLLAARWNTIKGAVALRRSGRVADAALAYRLTDDRRQARRIAQLVEAILAEEIRLDAARQRRAAELDTAIGALLGGIALILVVAGIVTAQDRRQRIRALEALNRQLATDNARRHAVERELALLAENATDAVFRLGLDGRFIYASPSVLEIIGLPPESLVGRSLFASLHPDDEVSVFTALHRLRSAELERTTIAYRVKLPRGPDEWTWLEASCGVIRDAGGLPLEIIASIRNVSQRKRMEAELREARRAAEHAAAAKSTFLAHMSHEIRTPMNGVVGFADLLLETPLSEDQRRYVRLIAESGTAMTHLLNDILDFSKVDAGQMTVADAPFDLHDTINACARLIAPALMKKSVALHCETADDLPAAVRGDALRLRQILLNLLGNAAKFTVRGAVTLRAHAEDTSGDARRIVIAVEDTGIGISEDRRAAIFDPFVQADAGTAAGFGGTGLGLPISLQLARLMGGSLTLTSEAGRGTCVTLTLPLVIAEARHLPEAPAPSSTALPAGMRPDTRVLVAEDHDVNQILVTAMLRRLGCRVDIASDGAQAVDMALAARDADPYALVLMDQQMPVLSGTEAARRIRAAGVAPEMLPIVALTANAYVDDVAACLAAGMQDHLAKPLKLSDLADVLARWAGHAAAPAASDGAAPPAMAGVAERYRARKAQTLDLLEAAARLPDIDEAFAAELADMLHKLAGTAGMFGEAALGDQARALELSLNTASAAERRAALLRAMPEIRRAA